MMKSSLLASLLLMASIPIANAEPESLQIRVHGNASLPTLIYLPGLHGDWTLAGSFRSAIAGKVRLVEFTYPRTLDWSLENYAEQIEHALRLNGITTGWLLGESFGSQVVWALAARQQNHASHFDIAGIILAGGFVKHPNPLGVACARKFSASLPRFCFEGFLSVYRGYAHFRHRHAPESLTQIEEFIARRTELDRQAMKHRLGLIAKNDPRAVARKTTLPLFALSGFWDPIVPRFPTRIWLKRNCPGFREAKTIFKADHGVLITEPEASAKIIWRWMTKSAS